MAKQLTKEEALKLTDKLIQQKMEETGRSYMEISREFQHKFQERMEAKKAKNDEMKDQVIKKKLTKERFMEMVKQLAQETGKTELEAARELNYYLNQKLEQNQIKK